MKIKEFIKNNEKITVFSKKISSFHDKSKKFFLITLKLGSLKNPIIKGWIRLKWLLKATFNIILNGAFLFIGLNGSFGDYSILVKVFSYGILLFVLTELSKKLWTNYISYRFVLAGKQVSIDAKTEYDKYLISELRKRGIKE